MSHPAQRLLQVLGIRYPVVQGGMTFGSDGRLVAAVSEAGGLGTLGTFHYRTYDRVMPEVEAIRAATDRPFAVNVPFFENNIELVRELTLRGGVKMFTLGGWFSAEVEELKREHGLTVLVSVNSPTVARMVAERPLDVLIVQGNESGGANNHFTTRQLFELISPTIQAPILLAGGQWDGLDLHRALLLGAAGIQLGTRFFFCEESPLHPSIKRWAVDTNGKRPLTTTLSPVSATLNMRFIANKAFKAAEGSGEVQQIFSDKERVFALSEAFFAEQKKPILIYAGTGVHKLEKVERAGEIVESIVAGYRAAAAAELPALG
ncbi:MAG: NAD(P)H-dependent flavin oxidoreductase [Planctomycetota bacterium]